MRTFLIASLALLVACEGDVAKYRRIERERETAARESDRAMREYDSLKALPRTDSAEAERLRWAESRAFGRALLADSRRKDAALALELMHR